MLAFGYRTHTPRRYGALVYIRSTAAIRMTAGINIPLTGLLFARRHLDKCTLRLCKPVQNKGQSQMRYEKPETIAEATRLLSDEPGLSRILAGGTDVLVQMKSAHVEPDLIVDIKGIDGVFDVVAESGGFRIGAAVSGDALGQNADVSAMWPGVVEAFGLIGSTQVQGRATMTGNLCNGSPAADSVPALVAAGATVRVEGPNGARDVPVEEVPAGPGRTTLAKGEVVSSIFLPARPERASDAYLRFIPRTEMDIAVASAGVSQLPPHAITCGSARNSGRLSVDTPPVGMKLMSL